MPYFEKSKGFKMPGYSYPGESPLTKKGPVKDFFKRVKKWWDPRTDTQKQKETESYAYKNVAHDIERGDYSSLPTSHREAIKKLVSQKGGNPMKQ
tara:strand:- start:491 stop:775 length:285 start_codon:yes stop_codon:yes gene_type:complete